MSAEATLRMILLGEDRSAGKTLKGVGEQGDRTKSKLHSLSNVAGKLLAGGLLVAGAAAVKFAGNAAADEQAARRLEIALRNTTGATDGQVAAVEDWISAQGKALGITDDQLRPAMERLVTATHDVGKAQSLASLAMDISAGTGKSLEVVSMALAKAQNGNVASLGRLGLKVKDADGKTKSLHDVTKDLAETYKGQASAAAESTAGKQARLNLALDEAGESIGYKLIPVMLKLTEIATAAFGWMERHPALLRNGAVAVGVLAVALAALILLEKAHAAAMAVQAAGGLAAWLKGTKAVTAAQWLMNAALSANPIALVVLAVAALVAGMIIAYKKSETFRAIVDGAFRGIAAAAKFMWDSVLKPVFKLWLNMWFTVIGAMLNGAAKAFGWVPGIGGKLKSAAKEFQKFRDSVNAALDGIHSAKTIKLTVTTKQLMLNPSLAKPRVTPEGDHSAVGADFLGAGLHWVGERGPELAAFPRGTRVFTAADSARAAAGGGDAEGVITLIVKSETGETIEKKLVRVKRIRRGRKLAFEEIS